MKSKEELFNMPIVELREYMNSLSNPEIQDMLLLFSLIILLINIYSHTTYEKSFQNLKQLKLNIHGKNIVRAEVIGTDGAGHSALAAVLKDKGVDVLICGGIGNGAVTALSEAGIDGYSGESNCVPSLRVPL